MTLRSLPLWWGEGIDDRRTVYVKKHRGGKDDAVEEGDGLKNAVFVAGLSGMFTNVSTLAAVFRQFGELAKIAVHPSKRSCMVLFEEASGAKALMKCVKDGRHVQIRPPAPVPQGLAVWVEAHKEMFPGEATLMKEADDWMMEFERRAEMQEDKSRDDEGGWTVVTRKKRKGIELDGHSKDKRQQLQIHRETKKAKDYSDLYSSATQKKVRVEAALSLRERFEDDKKRLAAFRARREFRC